MLLSDAGARSILPSKTVPNSNRPFRQPTDITLDTARGRALVTEDITGEVIAVNLTTGERTPLADSVNPTPPNLFNGVNSGIGLDVARNRLLIVDEVWDRLIAEPKRRRREHILRSNDTVDA